eukprot:TRINITY_DN7321_c0_g1_i1.p1 TRINITY_DN7321_c0_g1~~TRINITY_DN7321_c0_g1_i1.p1  ORF type:complete len:245 (+),score=42.63 TRINITY_DN7321_c0_g1_i1:23-736(+)
MFLLLALGLLVLWYSKTASQGLFALIWKLAGRSVDAALAERKHDLYQQHARGRVLDVGAGDGVNLPYLLASSNVTSITELEPNGHLVAALHKRLDSLDNSSAIPIAVLAKTLEELPRNQHYDTIICNLVLCSVPDLQTALYQIYQHLADDGQLLFIEHVAAPANTTQYLVQTVVQPLWGLIGDGCHLQRETGRLVRDLGFRDVEITPFQQRLSGVLAPLMWLASHHVMGRAVGKQPS